MTNEEAKEWLKAIEEKYIHGGDEGFDAKRKEAISMAIEALSEPKTGEWIMHIDDLFPNESTQECSLCGTHQPIVIVDADYCPKCGAKLQ